MGGGEADNVHLGDGIKEFGKGKKISLLKGCAEGRTVWEGIKRGTTRVIPGGRGVFSRGDERDAEISGSSRCQNIEKRVGGEQKSVEGESGRRGTIRKGYERRPPA